MFGKGGAAVVFADDFARRFQAQKVLVRGDADGVQFGGSAGDGPYFPADLFPPRAVGAFSVACPGQGVGYLMQDGVTDFMGASRLARTKWTEREMLFSSRRHTPSRLRARSQPNFQSGRSSSSIFRRA